MQKKQQNKDTFRTYCVESCLICGSKAPGERVGTVREHEYVTVDQEFPVYRCPKCSLHYLYPRPDVSELSTIYPPDYYSYHMAMTAPGGGEKHKRSFVQVLFYRLHLRNYSKRIFPFVTMPKGRPLRVIDVGCGVGSQLDAIRDLAPGCETHGVEMGRIAAEKARSRGHVVYEGLFEEADIPTGYFDVVMSLHVIEHVARPDLFVEKCLSLLSDDGILMLETPNTDCLDFDLLKKKHWGGYHAPRHWNLFRKETFQHVAKRFECDMLASKPYTTSNFWSWSAHSLLQDVAGKKTADALFPPVKVMYGGLQSFVILTFFAVAERLLLMMTGRANSIWVILKKK